MELPVCSILHGMDWLGHNLNMSADELDYARGKAAALPDGAIKRGVVSALDAAAGGILDARANFLRAEDAILKGMADSAARFRRGKENALEKPFSVTAVEKGLLDMMEGMKNAFAAVDRGLGKAEDAGRLRCAGGRYQGGRSMGEQEREMLLGVFWPMRTLGKLARQTHDAAHDAACRVDAMRPKARRIIKKDVLEEGIFREDCRKERGELTCKTAGIAPPKTAGAGDKEKPSILEQLQAGRVPEVAEMGRYYADRRNHGRLGNETQR